MHVAPEDRGQRLDHYLVRCVTGWSRSALARLIREGLVTVNGQPPRKAGQALETGDRIVVEPPSAVEHTLAAENRPLHVLYEDEDLLVVDKPAGLAVHPGPGHAQGTLVNALLGRGVSLSQTGGAERPGIVHRLDKETSGLLLVAKTEAAYASLALQFKERTVEKVYLALLRGRLEPLQGSIEAPIARDPRHRQRMAVVSGGREATTGYSVLARLEEHTLVAAYPHTGRTHQIRVHFASVGHPVAGDRVYGRVRGDPVPRLFLHAHRLRFRHPGTGQIVCFTAPLPEELMASLRALAGAGAPGLLARLARASVE
ncbi:MAG: RluA family pseudouridine synthase [Chloroflexi bacterium]|nr:RluA family pseudouridine synthase [Chloroflexota bacterium]